MFLARLGRAAWLAAFLFVICGALRLARFNVYSGVTDRRFFVGLPTPAAAGIVASTVFLLAGRRDRALAGGGGGHRHLPRRAAHGLDLPLPELQADRLRPRRRPVGVLLLVVLAVLIVATHPQWFLFLLFSAYVLSGPARPVWARRREAGRGGADRAAKGLTQGGQRH